MGSLRLERTAALSLVATALGLALLLAVLPVPAAAGATTLHVTRGSATVTSGGVPRAGVDGDALRDGDLVTTSDGAAAILAFADGSTLSLEPLTTVAIAEVLVTPNATVTRLVQTAGRTWSSVQRLASPRSRYEVRTPALTATVRGTAFEVEVGPDGATRVHTVEGVVSVSNGQGEVLVVAGTQTTATPLTPPAPPAPPSPAPLRTVAIGAAPVVVIDAGGRSCGRVEGGTVLQQIPGCVVQGDEIRIVGAAAASELRQREVTDRASAPEVLIVTPRPTPQPIEGISLPVIGVIPVQPPRGTTVPQASTTAAPLVAALVTTTLQPLPVTTPATSVTPPSAPAPAVPTVPPLPVLTTLAPTAAPATAAPIPTVTLEPTAIPTAVPTAIPTAIPTAVPTAIPTVVPTAVPTVAPSVTPGVLPTPTPTPAPTPTAAPTSTPSPAPTLPLPAPTLPLATPGVGLP